MPQNIYDVTVNGMTVPVQSDHELNDVEAYQLAKQQIRIMAGRPISDSGEPYEDWGTRLASMGQSMAHPETVTDFARLLLAGTDMTRLAPGIGATTQAMRGPASAALTRTGTAVESAGNALRVPSLPVAVAEAMHGDPMVTAATATAPYALQVLGRLIRAGGRFIAPTEEATQTATQAATPVVTTTRASVPSQPATTTATDLSAAERLKASPSFSGLPTTEQVWSDRPPTTGPATPPVKLTAPVLAQRAAQSAGVTLTSEETAAATELIRQGVDPGDVIQAVQHMRQTQTAGLELPKSFQGLPTNAEVESNKFFPKGMRGKSTPPKAK